VSKSLETREIAGVLLAALRVLAGSCDGARSLDGVGFNRYDSDWGHSLADEDPDYWDDQKLVRIYNMIRKYNGQLVNHGIDLFELDFRAAHPRTLDLCGNVFVADWAIGDVLFRELVREFSSIQSARWDGERLEWSVPVWQRKHVLRVVEQYDFSLSPDAAGELYHPEDEPENCISFDGEAFVFEFAYNKAAIADIKRWFRERWYVAQYRHWRVVVTPVVAKRVFEFADKYGVTVSPEAAEQVRDMIAALERLRSRRAKAEKVADRVVEKVADRVAEKAPWLGHTWTHAETSEG